jgi:hypothetical protein
MSDHASPAPIPTARELARLVLDTLALQRRYFDGERGLITDCKTSENRLRAAAKRVLEGQPSLPWGDQG